MMRFLKIGLILTEIMLLQACGGNGETADAYGNFEAEELTVSAETTGKLLRFDIREGQELASGDRVALIDTTQLYLRKMQTIAAVAAARGRLPDDASQLAVYDERIARLKREIERMNKLVKAEAAPSKQLDDLEAELSLARRQRAATASKLGTQTQAILAEVQSLEFQLQQVEDQLDRSHIINPINGTVLNTMVMQGELVMPGRPLYRIASLNPLILRAYLDEESLSEVKLNQEVTIKTDGRDGELIEHTGTLIWVSSEAEFTPKMIQTRDERTNQVFAVKVEVPNDGSLKIGMPGEVYLNAQ